MRAVSPGGISELAELADEAQAPVGLLPETPLSSSPRTVSIA